jgi:hypothetical protein
MVSRNVLSMIERASLAIDRFPGDGAEPFLHQLSYGCWGTVLIPKLLS